MPGETRTRPALIGAGPAEKRFVFPSSFTAAQASHRLRQATGSLLSIVFPSSCSICRQELKEINLSGVCDPCWAGLEPWQGPVCFCCGLPMLVAQSPEAAETLCPACREGEKPLNRARCFGLYRDSLRAAILLLKFQRRERWGIRLGSLLAPVCQELLSSEESREALLVPVPLHPSRLRQRGYNQADLLSLGLARTLSRAPIGAALESACGVLKKVRATPPQTGLSPAARRENVRGVFAIRSPERVRGRVIILVDDVMTTGATLSSCAAELRRAGAREIWGLTLARATPQFPDGGASHGLAGVDGFAPQRP